MIKLLVVLLFISCGSGDPLERPSGSPPEETPDVPSDETPDGPPETYEHSPGEFLSTRALYDAKNIEVFYTGAIIVSNDLGFVEMLANCVFDGVLAGHSKLKIGLLNGNWKDEGYTKNFLLNPDVERTWSGLDDVTSEVIAHTADNEFLSPLLSNTSECTGNDEVTCKQFMCGAIKD